MNTLLEILNKTTAFFEKKGIPDARLDAQYLLAHGLKLKSRMDLYLNFEKPLTPEELDAVRPLVARRAKREPLQHIIGNTSFRGHEIKCDKRALIPRPETEMLVDMMQERLKGVEKPLLADVGTGTGAIAIALAKEIAESTVLAADVSEEALALARENITLNKVDEKVRVFQGNLLDAIPAEEGRIQGLVANLPYIPNRDRESLQPEVRLFDPALALFGGEDGLDLVREMLKQTKDRLAPGAPILLEIAPGEEKRLEAEMSATPWLTYEKAHQDFYGSIRFVELRNK